jgi:hypothetical protein
MVHTPSFHASGYCPQTNTIPGFRSQALSTRLARFLVLRLPGGAAVDFDAVICDDSRVLVRVSHVTLSV